MNTHEETVTPLAAHFVAPQSTNEGLALLREAGAAAFDAVGWHFVELLAQRATAAGASQALLQGKVAQALAQFTARFEAAQKAAQQALDDASTLPPPAAAELKRFLKAGDFSAVHRRIASLPSANQPAAPSALQALVRDMNQSPVHPSGRTPVPTSAQPANAWRAENPRVGQFRNTLSKISVAKQVTQAMTQAPQNAGPINSHMLVLRSLALMRDASHDYLNRFMGYAETLLRLDEAQHSKLAPKASRSVKAPKPSQSAKG